MPSYFGRFVLSLIKIVYVRSSWLPNRQSRVICYVRSYALINTKGLTIHTHTGSSTWQQAGNGTELWDMFCILVLFHRSCPRKKHPFEERERVNLSDISLTKALSRKGMCFFFITYKEKGMCFWFLLIILFIKIFIPMAVIFLNHREPFTKGTYLDYNCLVSNDVSLGQIYENQDIYIEFHKIMNKCWLVGSKIKTVLI